ncbi:MAG: hypothetical protein CVT60_00515 [Actinobacteria bacterium HGW-Actinobacteria-10]|nr:MAG: hypothetical protein CVT60_00515 [Actinobacteria bacterium HGW-Actinobacteria-10]
MRKQVLFGVLAVVLLFGLVGMASADVATYNAAGNTQTGNVAVTASVNPKIALEITTPDASQTVAFGAVDPGAHAGGSVGLVVNSNKAFDLVITQDTSAFGSAGVGELITLTRSLGAGQAAVAKGQNVAFTDNYSIDIPWATEPGTYTASVAYTVTQVP